MIISKYYHISIKSVTKLISDVFEDQGEGVVMVKYPSIWYLWKSLNVLCTASREDSADMRVI